MQNPYEIDFIEIPISETFSKLTQKINTLTINRKKNRIRNTDDNDISKGIKRLKLNVDIDTSDTSDTSNINGKKKKRKYHEL
jgi:hypothetical protein